MSLKGLSWGLPIIVLGIYLPGNAWDFVVYIFLNRYNTSVAEFWHVHTHSCKLEFLLKELKASCCQCREFEAKVICHPQKLSAISHMHVVATPGSEFPKAIIGNTQTSLDVKYSEALRGVLGSINIWCMSLSHHYFCTNFIDSPNFTLFLISLTEMIQLMKGKKLLDDFQKYPKLRELENLINLIWPADIIITKYGISYPLHTNMFWSPEAMKLYIQQIQGHFMLEFSNICYNQLQLVTTDLITLGHSDQFQLKSGWLEPPFQSSTN